MSFDIHYLKKSLKNLELLLGPLARPPIKSNLLNNLKHTRVLAKEDRIESASVTQARALSRTKASRTRHYSKRTKTAKVANKESKSNSSELGSPKKISDLIRTKMNSLLKLHITCRVNPRPKRDFKC